MYKYALWGLPAQEKKYENTNDHIMKMKEKTDEGQLSLPAIMYRGCLNLIEVKWISAEAQHKETFLSKSAQDCTLKQPNIMQECIMGIQQHYLKERDVSY